jgi:hypothetical protein
MADTMPDGRSVGRSLPAIPNAFPQGIETLDDAGIPYQLSCPASIGVQPKAIPSPVPNPAKSP